MFHLPPIIYTYISPVYIPLSKGSAQRTVIQNDLLLSLNDHFISLGVVKTNPLSTRLSASAEKDLSQHLQSLVIRLALLRFGFLLQSRRWSRAPLTTALLQTLGVRCHLLLSNIHGWLRSSRVRRFFRVALWNHGDFCVQRCTSVCCSCLSYRLTGLDDWQKRHDVHNVTHLYICSRQSLWVQ